MEVTTDLNDTVDSLQEVNFKEAEHPSEQTKSFNVLESPTPATIPAINWAEEISCLRSPEFNSESLAGQGVHFNSDSQFGHESMYPNPPSKGNGDMVRELTMRNYKNTNLGFQDGNEQLQLRKDLQADSKDMFGRSRYSSMDDSPAVANQVETRNFFPPPMSTQRPPLSCQFGQKFSKLCWHLSRNERYTASDNIDTDRPGPARDNDLQVSGSQLFSAANALKQKGIELRCRDDSKQQAGIEQVDLVVFQKNGAKVENISQSATVSKNFLGNRKMISLRNFLKPQSKLNEVEKVHMFKLIADLVSNLHSQGFILKHLRPSHFVLLPSKQVKYVGPLVPRDQMEFSAGKPDPDIDCLENTLKRKRNLVEGRNSTETSSTKHRKIHEQQVMFSTYTGILKPEVGKKLDTQISKDESCACEICGGMQVNGAYRSQNFPVILGLSSIGGQNVASEVLKLEERWYASPEELNEGFCSSSSNIYSLGVLLFELFCHFESREAHYAAMLNLRHRILPPTLLSEQPREAGICLWMLHPDPSSRPKIRDILLSDVFCKDKEVSTIEQLSATIDYELSEAELLSHFLFTLKEQKDAQAAKFMEDLSCIEADLEEIKRKHYSKECVFRNTFLQKNSADISDLFSCKKLPPTNLRSGFSTVDTDATMMTTTPPPMKNFEKLESAYFSMRSKSERIGTSSELRQDIDLLKPSYRLRAVGTNDSSSVDESSKQRGSFFEGLCKYACYKKFEVRGSLRNTDVLNSSNVICSLSFDHNEDFFATAGASKKIKVFEYDSLLNTSVDIHYPVVGMTSKSKLSCVCWNGYIRNYLASTDYDGVVQLWDASTGQGFHQFSDHQKRAWSVDFSLEAPTKLASGSDDCTVKLWSIHEKNCINSIKSVANVCCVQFLPQSPHLLGFGSADYRIYCYDLRNTRIPWCTLAGHKKTVSYIKFVDSDKIVSASTDNTLKIWDLKKTTATGLSTNACSMTMSGHTNEKNFVGLSICDGYALCGSETNEVYAYHMNFPMPITSYKFGYTDPVTGNEIADDNGQFVSSVCWRRKSNTVLAANSSGCIKLLQMV